MDHVGFFSLGAFLGALATLGLRFIDDKEAWKQGLAVMISATLSGTAILFIKQFQNSNALGAYPLGLLISLLWAYIDVAIANIERKGKIAVIGWLHFIGVILVSCLAALLVLAPAVCEIWLQLKSGFPG